MTPGDFLSKPFVVDRSPVAHIRVLREDLLEGGSKLRFLPFLCIGADHLVYGGPFCGGAPLALSVYGREAGVRVTLFFAWRLVPHWKQRAAVANGARIVWVPAGRMSVVQARARAYAAATGARFLPLGFDRPEARAPFAEFLARVRTVVGDPPQIWCAVGSGMIARALGEAFPSSELCGVAVGLASRHQLQLMPPNVRMLAQPLEFHTEAKTPAPFPACRNYEAKAWPLCAAHAKPGALFYNVAGDERSAAPGIE